MNVTATISQAELKKIAQNNFIYDNMNAMLTEGTDFL